MVKTAKNYEAISKALEKAIHDQTEKFLNKNKVLYKYQSKWFHKSFSTTSWVTSLTDKIYTGFESWKYTGLILIDLHKFSTQ